MNNRLYRAAIVGLGDIAWRLDDEASRSNGAILTHASSFMNDGRVELVAGVSPDSTDREEFSAAFRVPVFAEVDAMLRNVQPDIVSICSPYDVHVEQALKCVGAGVEMIWLEKPPARNYRELATLMDVAKAYNSTILVGYQRRYDPCYQFLKKTFEDMTYGECRAIDICYSRGLVRNGSHMLDMLFFVIGDDVEVDVKCVSDGGDNPILLLMARDVTVTVRGADLPYHCIDFSILCEGGRLSVFHGGTSFHVERRVEHELYSGFSRLQYVDVECAPAPKQGRLMPAVLNDLISSFENQCEPVSSLRSAANTVGLIDDIFKIMRGGEGK